MSEEQLDTKPVPSEVTKVLQTVMVAVLTALVTFAASYGNISARVEANTKQIADCVTKREMDTSTIYNRQGMNDIISRLSRIETSLDRMTEKGNK